MGEWDIWPSITTKRLLNRPAAVAAGPRFDLRLDTSDHPKGLSSARTRKEAKESLEGLVGKVVVSQKVRARVRRKEKEKESVKVRAERVLEFRRSLQLETTVKPTTRMEWRPGVS